MMETIHHPDMVLESKDRYGETLEITKKGRHLEFVANKI